MISQPSFQEILQKPFALYVEPGASVVRALAAAFPRKLIEEKWSLSQWHKAWALATRACQSVQVYQRGARDKDFLIPQFFPPLSYTHIDQFTLAGVINDWRNAEQASLYCFYEEGEASVQEPLERLAQMLAGAKPARQTSFIHSRLLAGQPGLDWEPPVPLGLADEPLLIEERPGKMALWPLATIRRKVFYQHYRELLAKDREASEEGLGSLKPKVWTVGAGKGMATLVLSRSSGELASKAQKIVLAACQLRLPRAGFYWQALDDLSKLAVDWLQREAPQHYPPSDIVILAPQLVTLSAVIESFQKQAGLQDTTYHTPDLFAGWGPALSLVELVLAPYPRALMVDLTFFPQLLLVSAVKEV